MKNNQPVTMQEKKLRDGQELVTKTDLRGIITYVNPAFVEVSGYSADELMGVNHNVVRHPDMPAEAFADLWDTLKLARPWSKLVKNRCKNGDFYWVKANVVPICHRGEVVEYMSVRTKPSDAEIIQAEQLYQKLRTKELVLPKATTVLAHNLTSQFGRWFWGAAFLMVLVSCIAFAIGLPAEAMMLGPILAFGLVGYGGFSILKHKVSGPLSECFTTMQQISEGVYHQDIALEEAGELGELKRYSKVLAIKLGFEVNDANQAAMRAQRIKVALDNVSSNVMMADMQGDIIYMNEAVTSMMRAAEKDIVAQLPSFNVDTLVGSNFDLFHKNPAHQRNVLSSLQQTFSSTIEVGPRSFHLVANPVIDTEGTRLGTVVEWQDITNQLNAEREIEQLINDASTGKLDQRLDLALYSGFMLNIAGGVNQMLDAVVEPLTEVKRVLNALADGDLSQQMSGDYHGDFEELNNALNSSMHQLDSMVTEIRQAGTSINTGAGEIAAGNLTLSQRTESQAASLQETAASMEQMTSTVRQNADSSQEASQLANNAKELAEQGEVISAQVVKSMQDISGSSTRIAEIIGVIDEIAFQTNLLALNAAVEAARAGEQGRGFAVVAAEVRNLAQRSASAAKEIKELINDSVMKVGDGSRYVDDSGKALNQIMLAIQDVSTIISGIAAASKEQAAGIEQVNIAINQMDEGTQQNAALVEEAAAASSSMEEQAAKLQQLMNGFKVSTSGSGDKLLANPRARQIAASQSYASDQPSRLHNTRASFPNASDKEEEWEEF